MRVEFKVFRGTFTSWETLFGQAAEFAETLGQDRLINISHAVTRHHEGVVTVWYWSE